MADKRDFTDKELDDILAEQQSVDYVKFVRRRLGKDSIDDLSEENLNELNSYVEQMIEKTPLDEYTDDRLEQLVSDFRVSKGIDNYSAVMGKEQKKNADFSKERELLRKGNNALGYSRRKLFGR